jgi:mono/diheme cytochrome c family protein
MHRNIFRIGVTALALGAMAAIYLSIADPGQAGLLKPDDSRVTAQGKRLYAETCASCHGVGLEGEPNWRTPGEDGLMPAPPHDQSGHTWHHSEKLLFELTKFGIAKTAGLKDYQTRMPAYEDILSDEEIIAVLSYIKSRWPEELQRRHTEMSAHDQ